MAFFDYDLTYAPNKIGEFIFKIIFQDEKIRLKARPHTDLFVASNGWRIRSSQYPEIKLAEKIIYIEGALKSRKTCRFECPVSEAVAVIEALNDFKREYKIDGVQGKNKPHRLTKIFA